MQPAGGDGREDRGHRLVHLIIDGVEGLHGCEYEVMPDRIEAGSYACAAGITGGSIDLIGARPDDMRATLNALAQAGLMVEFHNRGIKVSANGALKPLALSTAPFPGFATDMQAQFMAMLCARRGRQLPRGDDLREPLHARARTSPHGRRHRHPRPLGDRPRRRGADGRQVMATDLRASMSLVLAGLAAEGETEVLRVYHLDRGYERLEEKLPPSARPSSGGARARATS